MKHTVLTSVVLGCVMVASGAAARYLTPTEFMSKTRPAVSLSELMPSEFGGWREAPSVGASIINPQAAAELKRIYTQTLSRTYVNASGDLVMLAIAYGADQRDGISVHYPEVCYPAQGFQLGAIKEGTLQTAFGVIPVMRLETNMNKERYEPVTYWTTVGDLAVTGGWHKKVAEMRYSLHGTIPDGLLFRVSVIKRDTAAAFAIEERFVRDLVAALSPASRLRLAGLGNASATAPAAR